MISMFHKKFMIISAIQSLKEEHKKKKNGMIYSHNYKEEFPELGSELRTSN